LDDSADRGIEAIASAVRSADGHMIGIALCFIQDSMSARGEEQTIRQLVALCRTLGQSFHDPYWLDRT